MLFLLTTPIFMSMDISLGKIVKERLVTKDNRVESKDDENCNYGRFVFTNCRNVKPKDISIWTNPRSPDWQVGFFDTDGEVYFNEIIIGEYGNFSNIVRNYWWNGKEGNEKKEGYYSLIKSVEKLIIYEQHVNDLLDYLKGRCEAGEHQLLHELNINIELMIFGELEETIVERLSKYFDNIWYDEITANLKTKNNIMYSCDWYKFKNCKGVVPQRLVINAIIEQICFQDADNEVHIPEIVMEGKADLKSIIQNDYRGNKYSLLPYVQTLVIRNNPEMLCDLADYINRRYQINNKDDKNSFDCFIRSIFNNNNWQLHKLNKNMKIVIEKSTMAFSTIKKISGYFSDVLVDNQQAKDIVCQYISEFQNHFNKYGLEIDQVEDIILADDYLEIGNQKLNVFRSNRKIYQLIIKQKIASQYFVCFHDTDKPVVINKIVIKDGGNLRCMLQNAYYNGTDLGFFSLLLTVKELEIFSNHAGDNQVPADLADYIEGKYVLNANWKQEELDKDMRINIDNGRYSLSISVAQRLRNYFKNVSIDRIWTPLETENIIDQECGDKYMFVDSREANPQKLTINAKLMGRRTLIALKRANGKVHIPEITIDEQGCFAAIVRNWWQNNKDGEEKRSEYYSLVQYVEMLTIRNNPKALKDFADYVVGKYEIGNSDWKLQQLSRDIKVVIEGPRDAFLPVLRISNYFNEVTVDGKQPENYLATWELWDDPDYKAFKTCFGVYELHVEPIQYSDEFQKELKLVDYAYNIRKSMDSIGQLIVRQKLDTNYFVCFHGINKTVSVDQVVIDENGNMRGVLQNAYYNNGQGGFFSLLGTAKNLEIYNNEQAVEDLVDYIDGKYALHPKWERQVLDKDMQIKLRHNSRAFSLYVAKRLRYYFKSVLISAIWTPLETENVIDQGCEYQYLLTNSRILNPQKLVINAKLESNKDLILFNDADSEVRIPEITIDEHGSFDAVVRNRWHNRKESNKIQHGFYSLVSHVETLTIQNNLKAVCDLDSYISGNYEIIQRYYWKVQKLHKNIIVRINGAKDLDEKINRLKEYFGYIFVNDRKALGNQRREAIANIKLDCDKIQQLSTANADKHSVIARADTEIAETKRRIERARARLGRRRARFREYLALAE